MNVRLAVVTALLALVLPGAMRQTNATTLSGRAMSVKSGAQRDVAAGATPLLRASVTRLSGGRIVVYQIPHATSIGALTAPVDGNVWFTNGGPGMIGYITGAGMVKEYTPLGCGSQLLSLNSTLAGGTPLDQTTYLVFHWSCYSPGDDYGFGTIQLGTGAIQLYGSQRGEPLDGKLRELDNKVYVVKPGHLFAVGGANVERLYDVLFPPIPKMKRFSYRLLEVTELDIAKSSSIWFADDGPRQRYKDTVAPLGLIPMYRLPSWGVGALATGNDNAIWVSCSKQGAPPYEGVAYKLSYDGARQSTYPTLGCASQRQYQYTFHTFVPGPIAGGASIWMNNGLTATSISRIGTAGDNSNYVLPAAAGPTLELVTGADGNIWTSHGNGTIVKFDTRYTITAEPHSLTVPIGKNVPVTIFEENGARFTPNPVRCVKVTPVVTHPSSRERFMIQGKATSPSPCLLEFADREGIGTVVVPVTVTSS